MLQAPFSKLIIVLTTGSSTKTTHVMVILASTPINCVRACDELTKMFNTGALKLTSS